MKIELTKEEWEHLTEVLNKSKLFTDMWKPNDRRNPDILFNMNIHKNNYKKNIRTTKSLLEKLGDEWKDDDEIS